MFEFKRQVALGLTLLFIFMTVGQVSAQGTQDQLNDVRQQMEAQQSRMNQAQQQVDTLSNQLQVIQKDLDGALGEYKEITARRKATEQQIENNAETLKKAEETLKKRNTVLNKRMRDIYENGQLSYLDVLLGASDFNDFITRLEFIKRIIHQDVVLITTVKNERDIVLEKRAQLEQDKATAVELEKAAEDKKSIVEQRKRERETLLKKAVDDRDTAEQTYQELQAISKRIEEMLQRTQNGSSQAVGSTGTMMWPISGPITSEYGWRTHPIFGTQRYHSGLDIGADYGDPIRAADSGVVVSAGWLGGYGKAVIIDHGGGLSTVYGHNSEILVSEGEHVTKGQVIALAGATGYATGPHCHFEVRQNGSPVDPMSYLP
ncbi:MAG: Peptidase [Firmicutes bacterium]|nr:Peptidase [Bacillota bacterium]